MTKKHKNWRQKLAYHYRHWLRMPRIKRLGVLANRPRFGKLYLLACLAVLLGTTLLWGWLGANLQLANADQLANAFLFQNGPTFHGAAFPDQHTFLLKAPLFYGVKLFGYSAASFLGVTLFCVLATVASFVYLLSRIERRPLVLGTLCLLLALGLLLVPAQPYAGGLLPVNMAMLTTRNLEYIFYLLSLVCLVKAQRLRSKQFGASVLLLTLVAASDKLFLSVSIGGALLALVSYALRQNWQLVTLAVRWLAASAAAGAGSIAVLSIINQTHLTHLAGKSLAGPYGAAQSAHSLVLGIIYGLGGLLTNFGANPAYDALTLRQIPHRALIHLLSPAGPAYLLNFLLLAMLLIIGWCFLLRSFGIPKPNQHKLGSSTQLATLLVWASITVFGLFVAANHYYQVDARYLTLFLFSGFIVLANWLRPRRLDAPLLLLSLPLLSAALVGASVAAVQTSGRQTQAYARLAARNSTIAQSLRGHHVDVLVGDYWRVLPVKAIAGEHSQNVLPLAACLERRTVLTSQAWQPDLHTHSVAYLLTLDGSLTDYPDCSLEQVVQAYGLPNNSALIDGTLSEPKELLLFYDRGVHPSRPAPAGPPPPVASVLPTPLADVPHAICSVPTIMNVVAHQDDDLLFLSPDLLHSIAAGNCVRTIYLTAGDAGNGSQYWLSREEGSEAAYSAMMNSQALWVHRVAALPGGQFVTISSPKGNDRISLIFMHLPDGNLRGEGFQASHHQSIAGLDSGKIASLRTVDGQSSFNAGQLTDALVDLMHTYQPAEIRTQSSFRGTTYPDHSDHMAAGRFAAHAHIKYETGQYAGYVQVPLRFYEGYPIHERQPNVSGEDLALKQAAFLAYARFDGGVCRRAGGEPCQQSAIYEDYLSREYQNPF